MGSQVASIAAPPKEAGGATNTLRLLVVDDDPVHRMVIGKVGEKAGYAVTTASSVEEAASRITEHKFDCISLDLSLNGQSGSLVLNAIARSNGDVLLIVISSAAAQVREETIETARDLRLKVIEIPKPVDLSALRAKLVNHASTARAAA